MIALISNKVKEAREKVEKYFSSLGERADQRMKERVNAKSPGNPLSFIASLVAVVGIAFYAIAYIAHYSFYRHFGITPMQAGMDKVEILSRAAFGIVLFVVSAIIIGGAFAIAGFISLNVYRFFPVVGPVIESLSGGARLITPRQTVSGVWRLMHIRGARTVALAAVSGPAVVISMDFPPGQSVSLEGFIIASVAGFAVMGIILSMPPRGRSGAMMQVFFFCVALVVSVAVVVSGVASRDAIKVREGGDKATFTSVIIGVHVEHVQARFPNGGSGLPEEGFTAVYLGEQSGIVSLYNCGKGEVVRISAAQVRIDMDIRSVDASRNVGVCVQ